jgi:DNA polymerase III sliding clamp (beta) subunit (PCNA family)
MIKVKFENNENLLRVIKTVESVLDVNSNGNVLKFVKLANINNKLQITAINPVVKLNYITDVKEISGDSALYDYKKLSALLNVIKGDVVIEDGNIKSKKCAYKIPCEDANDYPNDVLPEITNFTKFNMQELSKALESTLTASDKLSSGIMCGVHIGENKLIGCDSKRVAIESIKTDKNIENITLPKELIKEVLRLPFNNEVLITVFGEKIIICDENITICSSRLAEKYPKVEAVIPKDIKNTIKLKNSELSDALTMVNPIIDDITKECFLEYKNNKMVIRVNNGLESAKTSINIESDAENEISARFNIQYLVDMLKANGEEITVTTYNDNIGYKFTSDGNSYHYIMPMIN